MKDLKFEDQQMHRKLKRRSVLNDGARTSSRRCIRRNRSLDVMRPRGSKVLAVRARTTTRRPVRGAVRLVWGGWARETRVPGVA